MSLQETLLQPAGSVGTTQGTAELQQERGGLRKLAGGADTEDCHDGGRLPVAWLFFQQSFWFPQIVGFTLVANILLPAQVAQLAGPDGEGSGLGFINMLIQLSGFTMPIIGAWSDRHEGSWGRRRPFILWGQLGVLLSLWIMMAAEDMFMLSLGNFLYSALNNVPTGVYAAVLPELVPPAQRGMAGGFYNVMMLAGNLVGNGSGLLPCTALHCLSLPFLDLPLHFHCLSLAFHRSVTASGCCSDRTRSPRSRPTGC